jgi:hypothetical protein
MIIILNGKMIDYPNLSDRVQLKQKELETKGN